MSDQALRSVASAANGGVPRVTDSEADFSYTQGEELCCLKGFY